MQSISILFLIIFLYKSFFVHFLLELFVHFLLELYIFIDKDFVNLQYLVSINIHFSLNVIE